MNRIRGSAARAAAALFAAAGLRAAAAPPVELPAWVDHAGAQRVPSAKAEFRAGDYGAVPDGRTLDTAAIQRAIDACSAAGGGIVDFAPGTYLTGSLFLKSNVDFWVAEGVTILGVDDDADYPAEKTRIAGIEMTWPAGLINVNAQTNVRISGAGTIDGQGKFWWDKYYALRKAYTPRGLRWASDYDCQRARLLVVWRSTDVTVSGLHLRRSGFWTVQLTYSDRVTVDGIRISDNGGPSTDGVDIDSSRRVLVQNCDIDNNDDCICLKSGRDTDGMRVNIPVEYVVIRHNVTRHGGGIVSFGSETAGGIRHIVAYDDTGIGTGEGIRFKSARTRGGYIEDVLVRDIRMVGVPSPFTFTLDWNPSFSYAIIPKGISQVPDYWRVMATPVEPPERGLTEMRGITIADVQATGARTIFTAAGLPARPIEDVRWVDIAAQGRRAGSIQWARDWTMSNVVLTTSDGSPVQLSHCENVAAPAVSKAGAAGD
jgi:hypothetical protein